MFGAVEASQTVNIEVDQLSLVDLTFFVGEVHLTAAAKRVDFNCRPNIAISPPRVQLSAAGLAGCKCQDGPAAFFLSRKAMSIDQPPPDAERSR